MKLLLSWKSPLSFLLYNDYIGLNDKNSEGGTALDVFERQKEATDFEIGIMLCIAGALRASSSLVLRNYLLFLLLKGKCQSDERNAILEVAVLLVTTT